MEWNAMNKKILAGKWHLALIATLLLSNSAPAHDGEKHANQGNIQVNVATSTAVMPKQKTRWGADYFPNTTLITQDGEKLRFFDDLIKDKVVAINFIFTSCVDSCPLETARMKKVKEILGERVGQDIFFYSISIDPKTDTPAVLKAYKKKFDIGPDWTFLTGNEDDIVKLREKLGLYLDENQTSAEDLADHNLNLIIGNQTTGRWMKRSPFENSHILASQLGDWLHNWKKTAMAKNSYADAPKLRQLDPGEKLFRTRCSSCHAFGKKGVGPDLLAVTKNRDPVWLTRWLKEPDKMLAEKDPLAMSLFNQYKIPMPNMRLTERDIEDIISYMASETERLM
jgi:protein SCO1/2